jgi:hypothetical protein
LYALTCHGNTPNVQASCGGPLGLDPLTIYDCDNGVATVVRVCQHGCQINASHEDSCTTPGAALSCAGDPNVTRSCGGPLGLDPNTIYDCTDGAATVDEVCPNGCQINPEPNFDTCK